MFENLNVFFSGLDAAEMVFATSPVQRVTAYFDNAFQDINIGETIMDTTTPRLTCKYADVKDIPRGTPVTVGAANFSVVQIQPEGTGLAMITLAHED